MLQKWGKIYKEKINLVIVYISEAHAADEWPLSMKHRIKQHKTLEQRIKAANYYISQTNCEFGFYIDSFNAINFESTYSGWPERGIVVKDRKIAYFARDEFDGPKRWPKEIDDWLYNELNC